MTRMKLLTISTITAVMILGSTLALAVTPERGTTTDTSADTVTVQAESRPLPSSVAVAAPAGPSRSSRAGEADPGRGQSDVRLASRSAATRSTMASNSAQEWTSMTPSMGSFQGWTMRHTTAPGTPALSSSSWCGRIVEVDVALGQRLVPEEVDLTRGHVVVGQPGQGVGDGPVELGADDDHAMPGPDALDGLDGARQRRRIAEGRAAVALGPGPELAPSSRSV